MATEAGPMLRPGSPEAAGRAQRRGSAELRSVCGKSCTGGAARDGASLAVALAAAAGLAALAGWAWTGRPRNGAEPDPDPDPGPEQRPSAEAAPNAAALLQARTAADIDHDLRTPIGTIATAVSLLAAAPADEALRLETIEVIQRQVVRLTALAQRMGDLARALALPPAADGSGGPPGSG